MNTVRSSMHSFLLLVVALAFLCAPQRAEAGRAVRAGIYNFKPLVHYDRDGSPQGFFVKMLNRVAKQEGWEVQYVPGTWQQGMERLKADQIDLLLCVGYTPERAKFFDFPKEFLVLDWGLVYKGKGSGINTIMDLEGKTVSGLKGSVFSAGFLELTRQFQIRVNFLEMDQVSEVFHAVQTGKADAGVTSNIPGILNEAAYSVDRTPIIFTPVKLGFAVNAGKNPDLVAALDRDIAALKADRGSEYYHELGHLFGKKEDLVPKEVYWVLSGFSAVLFLSIAFIVVLRRQVHQKTAQLKEQGNLMRSILNGTTDAIFIKDTRGRYQVVNDEVVRLFDLPRSEILGQDDTRFFSPQEALLLMGNDRAVMEGGEVVTNEEHITTLNDARVYLATKGPLYDKSGGVSGIFGISRDITDLKRAETQARRNAELLGRMGEIALVGGWEIDLRTRKLFWSDMVRRIHEVGPETEVTLAGALAFYEPEARPVVEAAVSSLMETGGPFELELPMVTAKGNRIWCRARGEAEYQDGAMVRILGFFQDITERMRLEEEKRSLDQQMQHAQRLESLGVLSGGIAHDFNNILAIIIGHCTLAKLSPQGAEKSIAEIERAAERAADLCRQMLAYAGKSQFVQSRVDLGELLDDMVKMLKPTISQKIRLLAELAPGLPPIEGDASQLRQIAMNLVINASEAIGNEQGCILVALDRVRFPEGGAERDYLGKTIVPGSYLCLAVTDDGCGMDEETARRIFEPFYTTKFTGRGLGMSAVLGIITSHAGALQLESVPGGGTTFRIYLPFKEGAPLPEQGTVPQQPQPQAQAGREPWRGSGTVLLVDDELQVRLVARALLESFGFAVLEAGNGREALERYRSHAREITLVLTDIGMPVMDGYELLRALKELAPDLPVVVSSGFGDAVDLASRLERSQLAGTISKPYTRTQLREVLEQVAG